MGQRPKEPFREQYVKSDSMYWRTPPLQALGFGFANDNFLLFILSLFLFSSCHTEIHLLVPDTIHRTTTTAQRP